MYKSVWLILRISKTGMHKFSKHGEPVSAFWVPDRRHEESFIKKTNKY